MVWGSVVFGRPGCLNRCSTLARKSLTTATVSEDAAQIHRNYFRVLRHTIGIPRKLGLHLLVNAIPDSAIMLSLERRSCPCFTGSRAAELRTLRP